MHVVNMCEDFERAARTAYPLYYDYDGHWMPAGHEVVADTMYRELLPYVRARDAERRTPLAP